MLSTIPRTDLKKMLDQSAITFAREPGEYINAFAKLGDAANPLDCTVTPPSTYTKTQANDGAATGNYNVTYSK